MNALATYRIVSLVPANSTVPASLYLNADAEGSLTVNFDGTVATSQWALFYYPDVVAWGSMPGAVILVNVGSNKVLTRNRNDALTMETPTMIGELNYWTIADTGAIRSAADGSRNLNVQGGGPYDNGNPVISYGWDPGSHNLNERWTFQRV